MNLILEFVRQLFSAFKRPSSIFPQPKPLPTKPAAPSTKSIPTDPVIPTNIPVNTSQEVPTSRFMILPLLIAGNTGISLTPYTAKISAVLDHAGTSIDPAASNIGWGKPAKDRKVKAFNGEIGDGDATTSPPYGFAKTVPAPFFQAKEINYVGVYDPSDKHPAAHFLNYDGHAGYDFPYPVGTSLVAPADGYLYKAKEDPVDGKNAQLTAWEGFHSFYIDHQNGFFSWFLHCQTLHSSIENQILNDYTKSCLVTQGQTVAYLGKTGTPGAHLHFEVRDKNNKIIDPYSDELWKR